MLAAASEAAGAGPLACVRQLARPATVAVVHGLRAPEQEAEALVHRRQIAGYWAFGYDVGDNILQTVGHPTWLIVMANLMVVRTLHFTP